MKFVSLFSGIGGFDLAFERAGMECVSVCEIDKNAQSVLRRHFPKAELFDDVRKIGIATHGKKSIDIICGGFPCQDLSVAGKRAGLAGERSGLWFEFARIIDELEPSWVVIENVPGLLSSDKGRDFAVIIQWLAQRGYGVVWRVFDAQYFGVPQRRRRVFLVASFGNGSSAKVLFERESGTGNTPPSREAGKEVAYSLRSNPSHSGDKGDGGINTTMVTQPLRAGRQFSDMGDGQSNIVIGTLSASAGGLNRPAGQGNELDFCVADTITSAYARNRGAQAGNASQIHNLFTFDANQNLRDASEDIAPTLLHSGDGKKAHSAYSKLSVAGALGVRRLTPTECERLQGFPDGWTAGQSDSARYRQLGNAVAVPVVEWIGKRIMAATCPTQHAPDLGQTDGGKAVVRLTSGAIEVK
jgi:DNA (cytosine-5)-methyltransferase 1